MPIYCQTLNGVWADYTRGFDVSQVTSSMIRSRNITAHLTLQMPDNTDVALPFQFRIIHGFTKFPVVADIHSATGTGGAYDGIVPNFAPNEKYQDNANLTLGDAIGISNGNYNVRGNCRTDTVRVLGDKTVTFTAETVSDGAVYFPSKSLNYAWNANKRMKLYPYVAGADASTHDGSGLTYLGT